MPVVVLMVAAGAGWESAGLRMLSAHPGVVVLKRCVDVDDLLAAATAGQADVAVLGIEAPGLDLAATEHLRRHGVRPVAVVPAGVSEDAARRHADRVGVRELVTESDLVALPDVVTRAGSADEPAEVSAVETLSSAGPEPAHDLSAAPGRVIAVWGPAGAPGRTTLAVALAAELAQRGRATVLVDADPYGGTVAQQLGILDEVSGLLAAARMAHAQALAESFSSVTRLVNDHLSVVTGLPRPDRWAEVRTRAFEELVEVARSHGQVVIDTGFALEDDGSADFGSRPSRNQLTLSALASADEIVVVGLADPVGLSRLARALVELRELTGGSAVRVVVNRMRPSLGWSEKEVAGMVSGFARLAGLHFLPEARETVDQALVSGRTLPEVGESGLRRAVGEVVDALVPPGLPVRTVVPGARGRVSRRRAGTARRW